MGSGQLDSSVVSWASDSTVSPRVRRWTWMGIVVLVVATMAGVIANDTLERRAIDYISAEQIFRRLTHGGFICTHPYFPRGDGEVSGHSTGTCTKGFATVNISVNPHRGKWFYRGDEYSEPWIPGTDGQAFVAGRNWSVGFDSSNRDSVLWARQVEDILGGEIRESLPQRD